MPVEFENDEEKKATKVVRDMLGQLRETRAVLKMLDRQIRAPRIFAKVGVIKPEIYRNNCDPQVDDDLSKLPAELQREVWSYLVTPADRLMLALTCKVHATVFDELRFRAQTSSALKKSVKTLASSKSAPKIRPAQGKLPTKLDKLYILCRLQDWMPATHKLCCECIKFRSKTRGIRKGALNHAARETWSGRKVNLVVKSKDEKEAMKELKDAVKKGFRCPECSQRAQLDTISAKKAHQELKREMARML